MDSSYASPGGQAVPSAPASVAVPPNPTTSLARKSGARRVFGVCYFGCVLDAMDAQLLSVVMPTLIVSWGLTHGEAGQLASATLLASAFGGWLAGVLADRYGRVRTLQWTIAWFSLFSLLSGLAQNYQQLWICRAALGLGFGGELSVGAVLVGEMFGAANRGKAVGFLQSGWSVGWGCAILLYALLYSFLPESYAWRVLFAVGVAPALLIVYLRRHIVEPAVFDAAQRKKSRGAGASLIFRGRLLRTTVLTSLVSMGVMGGFYAISVWLPTYLKLNRGLSIYGTSASLGVVILGSFCGSVCGAILADRFGRRVSMALFGVGALAIVYVYTHVEFSPQAFMLLGLPLGFFAMGAFGGIGAFLNELFPTEVRGAGHGFAFNFGRGLGALFPLLIGWLSAAMPLGKAIGLFAVIAYGTVFVALLLLPETKGRELDGDWNGGYGGH